MKSMYYKLQGHKPIPCKDIIEWAEWYGTASRVVHKTQIGEVEVSTVFLGIDHAFVGEYPPVLFETMIFGGENDGYQERYTTWEEAEQGHSKIVEYETPKKN
jgi:hypothetical protein